MTERPAPPEGFRLATSTGEVFEADSRARKALSRDGDKNVLRVYVDRQWTPGRVHSGVLLRRPVTRNVPMSWGDMFTGDTRRLPIDRIAIPVRGERA